MRRLPQRNSHERFRAAHPGCSRGRPSQKRRASPKRWHYWRCERCGGHVARRSRTARDRLNRSRVHRVRAGANAGSIRAARGNDRGLSLRPRAVVGRRGARRSDHDLTLRNHTGCVAGVAACSRGLRAACPHTAARMLAEQAIDDREHPGADPHRARRVEPDLEVRSGRDANDAVADLTDLLTRRDVLTNANLI